MAFSASRLISRLDPSRTALLVCDIQVSFRPLIYNMETVINRSKLCVNVCNILDIPTVVTQQYTKVFGPTVEDVAKLLAPGTPVLEKTRFSMLTPECKTLITGLNKNQILICGIESHVCVMQTVLDLLDMGSEVHVIADAVSSQRSHDRSVALNRMQAAGAVLTTSESMMFDLLRDSRHEKFKACSAALKAHNLESTWAQGDTSGDALGGRL
jgi:nicotinamidase-related amidase